MLGRISIESQPYVGIVDLETALARGNSFKNLFKPYKYFQDNLPKTISKKQNLLQTIMMYNFVITDLAEFIDTHKDDMQAIRQKAELSRELEKCIKAYEQNYEALSITDYTTDESYKNYVSQAWPWEKK